jgi:RNA polymerase sigma factor (sigma-70 family)
LPLLERRTCVSATALPDEPAALARHYGPLVFRAAYRVLGDAALAEDVQQEVFLRLLERPPAGVVSWPAFLTAAAVRAAIDQRRRQQRWWRVLPMWRAGAPTEAPSAEQAGLDTEQARRLREALVALPRREAQCFGLRYLQGMEIADIAQALGLSANNINVILHRARRRLEARLGDATEETAR